MQAGDTLWKIAQKYSTPNQLILAWGYRLPHSEKSYPFAKISTNDGKHGEEIRIPQEDDIREMWLSKDGKKCICRPVIKYTLLKN
ncbi:LysM peptidoglycan-binding domain-containing protein [Brevibacillus parabrevis]|uniref:LysM peptidoglycan-binding domain-containing protein n=1 Tax=Brevibacillus parabrevis TaxID=54914 RepID=UPI0036F38F21